MWEVVAGTWHIGFTDLTGGAGLLGQVEGRTAASVSGWIEAQTPAWRGAVESVAIDMCTVFKAAVRESLPSAPLVVDRFHVAQLANTALTEVRRRANVRTIINRRDQITWSRLREAPIAQSNAVCSVSQVARQRSDRWYQPNQALLGATRLGRGWLNGAQVRAIRG